MKSRVSWLPNTLPEFAAWYANFALKFAEVGANLGFTPAQILAVQQDNAMVQWLNEANTSLDAAVKRFNSFRDEVIDNLNGSGNPPLPEVILPPSPSFVSGAGLVDRVVFLAKRIKVANGYTKDLGKDMNILAKPRPQPDVIQPKLKCVALPNFQIELRFARNRYRAVIIEMQRDGSTEWTQIATATSSPYLDTTPLVAANKPEVRRYRIRYVKDNLPVGEYSDIVEITTER